MVIQYGENQKYETALITRGIPKGRIYKYGFAFEAGNKYKENDDENISYFGSAYRQAFTFL